MEYQTILDHYSLSDIEIKITRLICDGYNQTEIGKIVGLSQSAVSKMVTRIKERIAKPIDIAPKKQKKVVFQPPKSKTQDTIPFDFDENKYFKRNVHFIPTKKTKYIYNADIRIMEKAREEKQAKLRTEIMAEKDAVNKAIDSYIARYGIAKYRKYAAKYGGQKR